MKNLVILVLIGVLVTSCSLYSPPKIELTPEKMSDSLSVYGWKDYFGNVSEFEEKYNVTVRVHEFESENEMVSQVQSSTAKYDIIIASDIIVSEMNRMKLLSPIRKENIPNLKYVDYAYLKNSYDPNQSVSIPYLWGTTGIVVNRKFIDGPISWKILWNKTYKGKIAVSNDPDEVMGSALKYLGYSLNSDIPAERKRARDALLDRKYSVRTYSSAEELHQAILNEDIWAAQLYSRDFGRLRDQNPNLAYYVPIEGSALWVDNFAITRDSQHKYTAELFINFYLNPQINAEIVNNLWMASTNLGAKAYMNKEIINDKSIYLSPKVISNCEMFSQKPYTTRFG